MSLVVALAAWLPIVVIMAALFGCQTGTTGLARPLSDTAYTTATNTVTTVERIATDVIPAPWAEIFRVVCGVAIAGLTAWQTWTHSRITKIANGQTKTTPTEKT
jgi:hypothetical protein